ncbi:1-(5-phosphoribosyl)-5-[(5-phosphoribosylamino)methylideneamino]imidazole-4-carboxamide isomerase [Robiginitalea sp. SC105]|uniref:1-(5-phosphoribosyl)-5-[(5- phosphoribosylamino)methylideneamino]imidazole-4- carboxamide isomerase n=1 Tax=Robiginitalea sp. SC105 TaxID=2762332 RepID=UPI00163A4A50|nr:1-(5-phosphoribosyl)-5-[(5-phosphoribosylamino)methylideneamino]imidazole-4-carboxamide isomerase [Robiginitalea sp. SC105]MBC2840598.1 1-(5-phosphoribosyl)-5-[(5-phosphoribosylamino)methylideneamino]imidazole-4-carboxamide isomerase [Robiginitalea sp. SC105]
MRIIPAIDIIDGKCVRLTKGDYATRKVYHEDPLEAAKLFEDHGIRYLHLVDLDGARSAHIVNYRVLERIAQGTNLQIDFGGGLKSDDDLRIAFDCGARQVTGGSIAVKEPDRFLGWVAKYGPDRIILGADARDGKIAVSGWQQGSDQELLPFVQDYLTKGVEYVICTDISRDGMLQGPSTELYGDLLRETRKTGNGFRLIASGGIRSLEDLRELGQVGCEGAIIGKALYEGAIGLEELKDYIKAG